MKNKDDIKTFLVIIFVCIVCVVLVLVLSKKSNSDRLEVVNEYNVYFSNITSVNNYINCISANDSTCVYNLLSNEYINDNDITTYNVLENVNSYPIGSSLKVVNMDFVQIGKNFVYYINGMIYENGYESTVLVDDDFSIILVKDYDNLSFSLYPVSENNYKKILNGLKKINIEKNQYNSVSGSVLIDKEQVCVIYLSDFVNSIYNDLDYSYDLLSADMKKKYDTIDNYKSYINDNSSSFSTAADKCKLEQYDDKRVYTVIDSNENTYVFTENFIMNYKVDFYLKKVS